MNTTKRLTSVKIDEELWSRFKDQCQDDGFTFQKLAERSIHLYMTSPEFKEKVTNHQDIRLPR